MKKALCLFLCFLMLFSFAACNKSSSYAGSKGAQDAEKASLEDTVEISIPLDAIEEKYQNDLDAYCKYYGYESATLNKRKGTVTVVMNAFTHELLLSRIGMQVVKAIYEVEDNKDYPYVNKIESYDSENFSKVVLSVDASTYKKGAMAPFVIGQSCLLYQLYTPSDKYKCEVEVIDKDTKEVIETLVYTDKDE